MIETYLDSRENLRGIVQIMDLRHPPTPDDISLWSWLKEKKIPAVPILTKADKLSRTKWDPLVQTAARVLGISPDDFIIFSAQTRQGRNELLRRVKELILSQDPIEVYWFAQNLEQLVRSISSPRAVP